VLHARDVAPSLRPVVMTLLACTLLAAPSLAWGQEVPDTRQRPHDRYEQAIRELLESPAGLAFLDAYIAVQREYLYGADRDALFEGATAGLVEALNDPLSTYLDPKDAEAARRATAAGAVEIAQIGDLGLIRVTTFEGDAIGARFSTALDTLLANGARGLVLDLRGNGGGSILQGLQVLDRFLAEGELGYRRVRGVSVPIAYANPRAIPHPLVVLVDGDTASTAEIVAGTLQAYGRGRLIGSTTAGKGVGQTSFVLADGGEVRLVSFEWLLPGLRSIDSVGLTPDVFITIEPADPVTGGEPPPPLVSVGEEGGDPVLRLAVEDLRGRLGDELRVEGPLPAPGAGPAGPPRLPDPPLAEPDGGEEAVPVTDALPPGDGGPTGRPPELTDENGDDEQSSEMEPR
jgi:C-terminal processing protease CtpA/Prc